jgi:hypothetical protein
MKTAFVSSLSGGSRSLASLGLTEEILLNSARSAYLAFIDRTPHRPELATAIDAWGEGVSSLRAGLAPFGWQYDDKNNYSRSISTEKRIAIVVARGGINTGIIGSTPTTKCPKGAKTNGALKKNRDLQGIQQMKLDHPIFQRNTEEIHEDLTTWFYLYDWTETEIRSELSLPLNMSNGYINTWKERIILQPIPLGSSSIEIKPLEQPDIDISIKRKA